jgi:hypothetical protein
MFMQLAGRTSLNGGVRHPRHGFVDDHVGGEVVPVAEHEHRPDGPTTHQ